jgi:hypothetical protein
MGRGSKRRLAHGLVKVVARGPCYKCTFGHSIHRCPSRCTTGCLICGDETHHFKTCPRIPRELCAPEQPPSVAFVNSCDADGAEQRQSAETAPRKKRRGPKGLCHTCGRAGHRTIECPARHDGEPSRALCPDGTNDRSVEVVSLFPITSPGPCFKCGMTGHRIGTCPTRSASGCFECGSASHYFKDCPSGVVDD